MTGGGHRALPTDELERRASPRGERQSHRLDPLLRGAGRSPRERGRAIRGGTGRTGEATTGRPRAAYSSSLRSLFAQVEASRRPGGPARPPSVLLVASQPADEARVVGLERHQPPSPWRKVRRGHPHDLDDHGRVQGGLPGARAGRPAGPRSPWWVLAAHVEQPDLAPERRPGRARWASGANQSRGSSSLGTTVTPAVAMSATNACTRSVLTRTSSAPATTRPNASSCSALIALAPPVAARAASLSKIVVEVDDAGDCLRSVAPLRGASGSAGRAGTASRTTSRVSTRRELSSGVVAARRGAAKAREPEPVLLRTRRCTRIDADGGVRPRPPLSRIPTVHTISTTTSVPGGAHASGASRGRRLALHSRPCA